MSSEIGCNSCGHKMEYDEGEGNLEDGYDHYDCIKKTERRLEDGKKN